MSDETRPGPFALLPALAAAGLLRLSGFKPAPPRPEPAAPDRSTAEAPFDMMQQMFQTGLEVQQENARAMQRLFDTFWQDPRNPTETGGNGSGDRPKAGRTGQR